MPIDWNEIKFRASSWGNLMTEPKTKEEKAAGLLSITTQKELIKIYNSVIYGRKKEIVTAKMRKGTDGEADSIILFSRVEKKLFEKNETRLENEWFTGHPDLLTPEKDECWDIKSRWELDSFMPKLIEDADKGEEYQLQCYYSLTGAKSGGIANTLVDCPPHILLDEKRKLMYQLGFIDDSLPEFEAAWEEQEKLLTFGDIDYRERVIKQPIPRDDEKIAKMKAKVPVFRKWLHDFHARHMAQYPK
jgi:hypothetical protein